MSTLTPTLTLSALCSVASSTLDFGNVPNVNGNKNATGDIIVNCTSGAIYAIGLGPGANSSSVTTRKMKQIAGALLVNYGIFTNPSHQTNWGNTVGADTVAGTGNGVNQPYTAYGRIPGGQPGIANGGYSDTVQIVVTY